jgi:hypothetical protein
VLAKEEYATTWQEEVKGKPQAKRVQQPQDQRGAENQARSRLPRGRVTEDERAEERRSQDGGPPEGRYETRREQERAQHQAQRRQPQIVSADAAYPRASVAGHEPRGR